MRAQKLAISALALLIFYRLGSEPAKKKNTQHTHTHRTTNKMSRVPPYQSGFALSPSMGRAVAPPNHGTAAPQHHAEAASYRSRARCRWFAFFGGVEVAESKNRERGGALALSGRLSIKKSNNQIKVGVDVGRGFGEGARPGRNVWGGRLPFVWGG